MGKKGCYEKTRSINIDNMLADSNAHKDIFSYLQDDLVYFTCKHCPMYAPAIVSEYLQKYDENCETLENIAAKTNKNVSSVNTTGVGFNADGGYILTFDIICECLRNSPDESVESVIQPL